MRSGHRTPAIAFFLLTWLLGALWALATPVMGVPDEPAHVVRAASVVRGQVLDNSTMEQDGKTVASARVPETLAWPPTPCYALHVDLTPACETAPQGRGDVLVEVESKAAGYNPVYYALVGVPTLVAPGKSTVYVMRFLTAGLVAALVALAALALTELRAPRWGLVGLAAAVTPMVLFLAGSVNPNAVEIGAGLALWAALLAWFSQPDPALDRSRAIRAAVAGTVLVLSRGLAPGFFVLIVAGSLLLLPRGEWRRTASVARIPIAVVGAATVVALAWTASVGSVWTGGVAHPEYEGLRRYVHDMLVSLNGFERQMIGVFGWLDTPAPEHVYTLWIGILGFLVFAVLAIGGRRERLLVLGLLALSVLFPIVAQYPAATTLGLIWQGRYHLPLMVGLPLVAGVVLASSERWEALTAGRWAFWAPVGTLAVLQVGSYLQALHRNVIGLAADWFGFQPLWQPPLGWVALTLAYACAVAAWTVSLVRLGSVPRPSTATRFGNERVSAVPEARRAP
ncbi:MAG TPA: DUF2142 domain-containing protein [Gaiella sp.]